MSPMIVILSNPILFVWTRDGRDGRNQMMVNSNCVHHNISFFQNILNNLSTLAHLGFLKKSDNVWFLQTLLILVNKYQCYHIISVSDYQSSTDTSHSFYDNTIIHNNPKQQCTQMLGTWSWRAVGSSDIYPSVTFFSTLIVPLIWPIVCFE